MKRKHKVLSLWASILLTLVGLLTIAGITALVMYLTGRLDEEIIWPENMAFSQEVDGMGYFSDEKNLYIASDSYITLTTSTPDVTKDEVTLFVDEDKTQEKQSEVLSVPKKVKLNEPFKITLGRDAEGAIKGGMATIRAVSEDETLEGKTLNIFVDKPARGIDVQIAQSESNNVVIGSTFRLETEFTPQDSKQAFSSDTEEKKVFLSFSYSSRYIGYDWDNENFYAKLQTGSAYEEITVYAFANAYFQKNILERFSSLTNSPSDLHSNVTTYLKQNYSEGENTYFTKTVRVYVTDAKVTIVNMESQDKKFEGTRDKFFVMTTSSKSDDENSGTLGISVKEDDRSPDLDGLLGNVGIKITKGDKGIKIDNRRVDRLDISGKILKVVASEEAGEKKYKISSETFDYSKYDEYVDAPEGTEYYILPSTSSKYSTDYYWRIVASDTNEHTISVNFFYEQADGEYANFFDFEGDKNPEKTFVYVAQNHQDEPATWKSKNTIELEITFDEAGEPQSAQVQLSDFVEEIPSTNVYTKTKYFLLVNALSGDLDDEKITQIFNVKAGVNYEENFMHEPLNIWGQPNEGGYMLYELESDDILIAKQKLPNSLEAYVLIAIVKTDVDNKIEATTDQQGVTRYAMVNLSDLKAISVKSSLSIKRMNPRFSFTSTENIKLDGNTYYVPAINRDENKNRKRMIEFTLKYECADSDEASWAADARSISDAFNTGAIQVVCTDISNQEFEHQYVTLNGVPREMFGDGAQLSTTGTRTQTLYFVGEIAISENLFASKDLNEKVSQQDIYLQMRYNNGHDTFTQRVLGNDDNVSDDDHFVVYYQTPEKLTADYLENPQIQGATDISVTIGKNVSGDGNGDVELEWGNFKLSTSNEQQTIQAVIQYINNNLNFKIFDKHEQEIDANVDTGLYRILFREEGADLLRFNDQQNAIINFNSTSSDTKTTTLVVEVNENVPGGETIMTQSFNFTIKSVGVRQVDKESSMYVVKNPNLNTNENYVDNQDTTAVTIQKYIVPGTGGARDVLDLTKLIRIYLEGSDSFYTGEIVVKFNDTFINQLEEKENLSKDLATMLHFDGYDDVAGGTMATYADKPLTTLSLLYPFNRDTTLEFVVTDRDNSRFYIPLNLVILKQVSIVNGIDHYNDTHGYSDYLVKLKKGDNDNTSPALFADVKGDYDLEELFQFSNIKVGNYSWSSLLSTEGLLVDHTVTDQSPSLLSIVNKKLHINKVTNFDTVTFTIYFGVNSSYALNTGAISIYINPNIGIVEKDISGKAPFVNLSTIAGSKLLDNFTFYRATSYIDEVIVGGGSANSLAGDDVLDVSDFRFTNSTPNENNIERRFINIDKANGETRYLFNKSASALALALGQNAAQDFTITTMSGDNVNVVRIQEFKNGDRKAVLCVDENGNIKNAEISIEIGFGENEAATVNNILYREKKDGSALSPEKVPVQIVKFKVQENENQVVKTYVLLASETSYKIYQDNGFNISSWTGHIGKVSEYEIYSGVMDDYFSASNSLTVSATVQDANGVQLKDLTLTLNVIVSRIGEKFVYYAPNGVLEDSSEVANMKFNSFVNSLGEVDFETLIQNPDSRDVFQQMKAGGTYTIFHVLNSNADGDVDTIPSSEHGYYGFYYDYVKSGAKDNAIKEIQYEAYRLVDDRKQVLNWKDICSLDGNDLTIHHLSKDYENTYIEITLPFRYGGFTFSYKYRIKVLPDFNSGSVNYPYAENVEHLDRLANSYVGEGTFTKGEEVPAFGKYEIDLEEDFDQTNSKFENGSEKKRFVDPTLESGDDATIEGEYVILSAEANGTTVSKLDDNNFFAYEIQGTKLVVTLKQENVKLKLVLQKTFTINGLKAFGGDLVYELRFNMGTNYTSTVTPQDASPLKSDNGIFEHMVRANEGEETYKIDIKNKVGENVSTPVNDFDFYIKATDGELSSALEKTYYLKAGTTVKNNDDDSDYVLQKRYYYKGFPSTKPTTSTAITIDGKTYYAQSEDDWIETYAYLDENGKIHIKPLTNVEKDVNVEIGVFTNERVALKLAILVTGIYDYTPGKGTVIELDAGKTYHYVGETNSIFTSFVDKSASDTNIADGGYTLVISQIETDANAEVIIQNNPYNQYYQFKKSQLLKSTIGGTWQDSTIEFAHLPQDVTFKFEATVTKGENTYTFTFDIKVKASVNIETIYTTDIGNVYGGVPYLLSLNAGTPASPDKYFDEIYSLADNLPSIAGTSGAYIFANMNVKSGETLKQWPEPKENLPKSIVLTPAFVGSSTESDTVLTIAYIFDGTGGQFTLMYNLRVKYMTWPSVNVDLHTPAPDGQTYSDIEYLDTANEGSDTLPRYETTIEDFFNSPTDFAMQNGSSKFGRVTVDEVEAIKNNNNAKWREKWSDEWTIIVANIQNVVLKAGTKTITSDSPADDRVLLNNESASNMDLTFTLQDSSQDGRVEFEIVVNNVRSALFKNGSRNASNYVVQVLRGGTSAVSILTNPTNYDNDRETIYAEDLATYSEKELFENDRIVQFNAKTAGTYYLKFTQGTTMKAVKVTATSENAVTNVDAGEKLTDFEFAGVYKDYNTQGFVEELDKNTIFNSLPIITSRLVAIYAKDTKDERKIVMGTDYIFNLTKAVEGAGQDETSAPKPQSQDDVKLTKADLNKTASYTVQIKESKDEDPKTISTSGKYDMYLTIDFEIKNVAEDANEYYKKDLIAGHDYTLLGNAGDENSLRSEFQIRSTRRNTNYTREMMIENSGNFDLQLYGFANVPILEKNGEEVKAIGTNASNPYKDDKDQDDQDQINLALTAGTIHKSLQTDEVNISNGETIKYLTGLTPRAKGFAINGDTHTENNDTNTYNYIALQGQIENGREVDYTIKAQGCNNDGNYVMVKVIYSVDIGDETVSIYHNILFRVVPDTMNGNVVTSQSNTQINFKQNHDNGQALASSNAIRTFGGDQTYANNYSNPYLITDTNLKSNNSFNLVNTTSAGAEQGASEIEKSVVRANMYGNKTNSARLFTFTYTDSAENISTDNETKKANDYSAALNITEEGSGWTTTDSTTYTGSGSTLSIGLKDDTVQLGEKLYYIDFVNDFGYQGRFFFKIVATDNPVIKTLIEPTFAEGDKIAVGAEYKTITVAKDQEEYYQYSETITYTQEQDRLYYNELKFSQAPTEVKLVARLQDETSISRKYTSINDNKINIYDSEISSDDNKWKKIEDGKNSEVSQESLKGATISIFVKYDEKDMLTKRYDVQYGKSQGDGFEALKDENGEEKYPLTILSTESSDYVPPKFVNTEKKDSDLHTVTLSNIAAYGFDNNIPVDSTTASKKTSKVGTNGIEVERIDFYYAGKWIGGSYGPGKAKDLDDESEFFSGGSKVTKEDSAYDTKPHDTTTLITNAEKYFYNGTEFEKGTSPVGTDNYYTVPTINPRLFGNETTLNNVTMSITLTSNNNTAILSRQVSISRAKVELFDTKDGVAELADGESPRISTYPDGSKTANSDGSNAVLNDTLEITLKSQESTTFILHDQALGTNDAISMNNGNVTMTHTEGETTSTITGTPITITNTADYTQTYYYSITNNLIDIAHKEENFKAGNNFYIYRFLKDGETVPADQNGVIFSYNGNNANVNIIQETKTPGEDDEVTSTYTIQSATENKINAYTAPTSYPTNIQTQPLRMYIPSVDALSGDGSMSRTLYFLYIKDGESYQYTQQFKVSQLYKDTQATTSGNDKSIEVSDYIEVSKDSDTFYYIPLSGWAGAGDVNLVKSVGNDTPALTSVSQHQFTFSISNENPSGSAFVDEFGTLTTSKNFSISDDTIVLKIFMNVSGYDGNFEERNTKLEIGSYTIRLKADGEDHKPSGTQQTNSAIYNYKSGNGFVFIPKGTNMAESDNGFALGDSKTFNSIDEQRGDFACEVGKTVDFVKLFERRSTENTLSNITYHVLYEGENVTDGKGEIYCQDNINHWTFTSEGTKQVVILMTGRSKNGGIYQYKLIKLTMHVYGTNALEQKAFALDLTKTTFELNKLAADENAKWFTLDRSTNEVKEITSADTISSEGGLIQEKTYIMKSGSTYKLFNITFYLYDGSNEAKKNVSVAITPGTTYHLQDLVPNMVGTTTGATYRFFEYNTSSGAVTGEVSTYSTGVANNHRIQYLLVTTNSDGKIAEIKPVEINFMVMNTTVDKIAGVFANKHAGVKDNGEEVGKQYVNAEVINDKVKELFELGDPDTFTVYTRADNGALTEIRNSVKVLTRIENGVEVTVPGNQDRLEFVVTYQIGGTGATNVKRVALLFWFHENAEKIDVTVNDLPESVPFMLNRVNEDVLSKISEKTGISKDDLSGAITYSVLNETNGMIDATVRIPELKETGKKDADGNDLPDFTGTFYVEIGNRAFLIELNLNVEAVS